MTWVSPDEFSDKFPFEKIVSRGTYGAVFQSGEHAIKVQGDLNFLKKERFSSPGLTVESMRSYLVEVHFGSFLSHPNIVPLVGYSQSIDNANVYLIYKLGESITDALDKGKITLEKTMIDIAKALCYIHSMGVVHCDIKPENIVYYNGNACLIDFGIAREVKEYKNKDGSKDLVFKGIGYADCYRDPEYKMENLLKMLVDKTNLLITGNLHIDNFIKMCTKPLPVRCSIGYICATNMIKIESGFINVHDYNVKCNMNIIKKISTIFNTMQEIFIRKNISARAVFLGAHLFRYVSATTQDSEDYFFTLCCHVCCYVAALATNFTKLIEIEDWLVHKNGKFLKVEFFNMMTSILYTCNGVLFTETPWDYAISIRDLSTHLKDIFREDYSPNFIRNMSVVADCKDCNYAAMISYAPDTSPFVGEMVYAASHISASLNVEADNILDLNLRKMLQSKHLNIMNINFLIKNRKELYRVSKSVLTKLISLIKDITMKEYCGEKIGVSFTVIYDSTP